MTIETPTRIWNHYGWSSSQILVKQHRLSLHFLFCFTIVAIQIWQLQPHQLCCGNNPNQIKWNIMLFQVKINDKFRLTWYVFDFTFMHLSEIYWGRRALTHTQSCKVYPVSFCERLCSVSFDKTYLPKLSATVCPFPNFPLQWEFHSFPM